MEPQPITSRCSVIESPCDCGCAGRCGRDTARGPHPDLSETEAVLQIVFRASPQCGEQFREKHQEGLVGHPANSSRHVLRLHYKSETNVTREDFLLKKT
ncbi:unnamed protein product [Arctia plantaginis]|uniref:Uncharacterized protein n=1 Tax=Arctia plantaginis TaxID=874455 RepID=A0A8S1AQU3_ARCPL|nr:unnamed protein product [Arctia plantaginis]